MFYHRQKMPSCVAASSLFVVLLLVAFPSAYTAMQHLPSPHPLVEGFHGVLLIGVHLDFFLLNRCFFAVSPLVASRQQQDGQGRHCCRENRSISFCLHSFTTFFTHFRPSLSVMLIRYIPGCRPDISNVTMPVSACRVKMRWPTRS